MLQTQFLLEQPKPISILVKLDIGDWRDIHLSCKHLNAFILWPSKALCRRHLYISGPNSTRIYKILNQNWLLNKTPSPRFNTHSHMRGKQRREKERKRVVVCPVMILRNSSPQTIVVLVIPMLFLNAVTEINFKPKFKSYYTNLENVMKVWI